ncbi:hypothetical protein [Modestobacter roseus]|uniref:hypothetical protein n=1 Tax=Modestobacter roseus TaxID=1181884 RepID=UPI001296F902|nr:hypothetical protein [Modestobacter roseus]MQA34173.1 hypothetical protein [Modestobacter roseus]
MTSSSDGPGTGPGEEPIARTGRPPVPGRAPTDDGPAGPRGGEWAGEAQHGTGQHHTGQDHTGQDHTGQDHTGQHGTGQHHTERVPFPLPALHRSSPQAPQTGELRLGGYPPQVPGAARRAEPATAAERTAGESTVEEPTAAAEDADPRNRP